MDKPQRVGRNAQILKYLTERSQRVGATKLVKLAYLADIVCRKYLGRPVTEFEWILYDYGPFDFAFYGARDELISVGAAEEQRTSYPKADYEERTLVDLGLPVQYELSETDVRILDYVIDLYGDLPLQGILEKAYETRPMELVQAEGRERDRLPMEVVDNEERDEMDFGLEELDAARRRIRSGRYVTLGDFERELRAKIGRGGGG